MTDPSYVHYVLIIDRSGSMHSIRADTEGGIRAFVKEQLDTSGGSKRTVSLYQFDTEHDCVHDFADLAAAGDYTLIPRGATALLDAVGQAVTEVGRRLKHMPEGERPGSVMAVMATDGYENSSKEYTRPEIKEMLTHQQEKYGWKVTYLGANQDAFAEAASIGIRGGSTLLYYSNSGSVNSAWATASAGVCMSTAPTSGHVSYTPEQREAVAKP
jgi:hypothetical protein